MLIFGATANCIPWVYVPEILPLHVRAKGTAVGISSNWIWNFVVVMITPAALSNLKWKAYLIFMCTNLAFIPLVYYCYPETSNLTLEEVDYLFVHASDDAPRKGLVGKVLRPQDPVLVSFEYRHLKLTEGDDAIAERRRSSVTNGIGGSEKLGGGVHEEYANGVEHNEIKEVETNGTP